VRDEEIARFRAQMLVLQRRLRRETPVLGLSLTAIRVLNASVRLPGDPQPRHLAEDLQMTSSNVAAALRELEEAGLVARQRDPQDGRRVLVVVTDRGQAMVADRRRERDSWLGQAIGALLDENEQRALLAAGELMERLAEYVPPATEGTR
jgi:DNA-binding MarR family transcriptional regulator